MTAASDRVSRSGEQNVTRMARVDCGFDQWSSSHGDTADLISTTARFKISCHDDAAHIGLRETPQKSPMLHSKEP